MIAVASLEDEVLLHAPEMYVNSSNNNNNLRNRISFEANKNVCQKIN